MNTADQQKCLSILTATITAQPVDWQVIVKAIEEQMAIKNWLKVRGVLQWMINQGQVKRVASVHVEEYYAV